MNHPPGTIGILAQDTARYTAFQRSLMATRSPRGSHVYWAIGTDVVKGSNLMAQHTLDSGAAWLWILGDDHVWESDLLQVLLGHELPVVAPLVCRKSPPFQPVAFETQIAADRYHMIDLAGRSGLVEVDAVGGAGILIQRHVLEAIPPPWFAWPNDRELAISEDIYFCQQVRAANIPIHVDLDHTMGHLFPTTISAHHSAGQWEFHFDFGEDKGLVYPMPDHIVSPDREATVAG